MLKLFRRFRYWSNRRALEAELAEELELHRAMKQERLEHGGMTATEAAYASRRVLGNAVLAREESRDVWAWLSLERLWRDTRYGARLLKRQPTFAATAIMTLAVGIAATTTVASVVEAELWRALPFPEPDRLVAIHTRGPGASASAEPVSVPDFLDWRSQSRGFEEVAAFRWSSRHVMRHGGAAESVRGLPVTSNFFTTLRRMPALGRSFAARDEGIGRSIILSDACWRRLFSADPQVIGREVAIDDAPFVVVGIAAPDRLEFIGDPDYFTVIDLTSAAAGDRRSRNLVAIGRLNAGVDRGAAEADLQTVAARLAHDYPADHKGHGIRVEGLREAYTGWNWRPLYFFLGAALFVLLLSCANVANLLLARAIGRQREFAVRGALGGGRGALLRQLLVEGILLALPAAAIGVLLASWTLAIASTWLPPSYLGRGGQFALDSRVLMLAIATAGLTAVVFGLAPALVTIRRDLSSTLAQGGRTVTGSPLQQRARRAFVVVEVMLALVLLVGAGLFLNSFVRLTQLPLGFDPRDRLIVRIPVAGARYAEASQIVTFSDQLIEEMRSLPGVTEAAIGNAGPLEGAYSVSFVVADRPRPNAGEEPDGLVRAITPAYLRALDIRRVSGREFTAQDAEGTARVAMINERLAHRLFAGENPLGRTLVVLPRPALPWVRGGPVEIVGVVSNIKDVGVNEVDFNDIYLPFAQNPMPSVQVFLRTAVPAESLVDPARRLVHRLDPNLPVVSIQTMEQRVRNALRGDRFHLLIVGAFAALATLLAAVGIYGAMACAVAERTQEFGVRLALGASRSGILGLALGQSAQLGLLGTVLGVSVSVVLARILGDALYLVQGKHEALVYGVSLTDPLTLACACAALLGVTALAGLIPARRATLVDPIVALRAE